jgi:hypothetical protein
MITLEEAMGRSSDVDELKTMIGAASSAGGTVPPRRRE